MNYIIIGLGVLALLGLGLVMCVIAYACHLMTHMIELVKRIERHVGPESMMFTDGGVPPHLVDEIMNKIRGNDKDIKTFLDSLNEESDEDEQE